LFAPDGGVVGQYFHEIRISGKKLWLSKLLFEEYCAVVMSPVAGELIVLASF
jgi:hypothetical protein